MQPYGGFWIRVLAYLIDWMILQFATSFILGIGLGSLAGLGALGGADGTTNVATVIALIGLYLAMIVSNWLYFALLESSRWQGTVGKQALKLIVTDDQGQRIGFWRATGRYFAKIVSAIIFMIGFFMVGWTQRKQGLHDMMASTLVQRSSSPFLASNNAKVFE